jgi:hypothetical protein
MLVQTLVLSSHVVDFQAQFSTSLPTGLSGTTTLAFSTRLGLSELSQVGVSRILEIVFYCFFPVFFLLLQ